MKDEIERMKVLLGLHFFIQERLFNHSKNGYITRKNAIIVIRRSHNISKSMCPIVLKGMEILGLIEEDGKYIKVNKPKESKEELIFEFKKKLKLI